MKAIPLQPAPQQELSSLHANPVCKYFQIALLKKRRDPGNVIHCLDVLDPKNEKCEWSHTLPAKQKISLLLIKGRMRITRAGETDPSGQPLQN